MTIAIYMEGGGNSMATRAALRQGMEMFLQPLKGMARARGWHLNVICRGPRGEAFRAFCDDAVNNAGDRVAFLLVDAERPVTQSCTARDHLQQPPDRWDLGAVSADRIHLMVVAMEAWIVSDPSALARYYGHGFCEDALPSGQNLELVLKYDLNHGLRRATQQTGKGRYHKTRHASDLLKLIKHTTVADRCPHYKRMFDVLGQFIAWPDPTRRR